MHHSEQNVHISVLCGALWDMEQLHRGICEIGLLRFPVISFLAIVFQQTFARATTVELSCHVLNFVVIVVFGWQENEISITLEF